MKKVVLYQLPVPVNWCSVSDVINVYVWFRAKKEPTFFPYQGVSILHRPIQKSRKFGIKELIPNHTKKNHASAKA